MFRGTPHSFSARADALLTGTAAFCGTQSLLVAKNSPPLCADQVREALERITLNCVIKGYILPYMNKVDESQLRKKPYVSELLFLTLQPKEHSFKIVK